MSTPMIIMLIVLVVLIGVCVALYFFKKKMKLKDAGLPAVVLENTPKYLRRSKVPVVKAKVGPKVMTLMCDVKVFEVLPVKKEAKVVVSGIYITGIKSVRGGLDIPEKKKKKRFFSKKEK